MAVAAGQQGTNVPTTILVEERYYELDLAENERALRTAVERAAGMRMEELAPGMWFGSRATGRWTTIEVTARAQDQRSPRTMRAAEGRSCQSRPAMVKGTTPDRR